VKEATHQRRRKTRQRSTDRLGLLGRKTGHPRLARTPPATDRGRLGQLPKQAGQRPEDQNLRRTLGAQAGEDPLGVRAVTGER
jgi:hypothetical protein